MAVLEIFFPRAKYPIHISCLVSPPRNYGHQGTKEAEQDTSQNLRRNIVSWELLREKEPSLHTLLYVYMYCHRIHIGDGYLI